MSGHKTTLIRIIVGLVLLIGGIYAVFFVEWGKQREQTPPMIRPLKIYTVGQDLSQPIRKYPGKVAAIDKVTLGFQVDGPLIELPLRKGQIVTKGELLARIDPRDFENRLASAKAELDQAATQLERIERAARTGAVSKTDLTNAQAAFELATANHKIALKALEDTNLLSPFDGLVSNIFVDNFQNVQAKQDILTIQKDPEIKIEVNVPEERIIQTKEPGEKRRRTAVFDSLPNREFEVRLFEYELEADPVTQTYLITFAMPSPEDVAIFPGMTASIWEYPKTVDQQAILLAPIEAVPVDTAGRYYVWILQKDTDDLFTVHRREVSVGHVELDKIQVLSGVSQGDRIAASGVHMLKEGQKVREFIPKSKEAVR